MNENNSLVSNYLKYLRDVSRKIVNRSGLDNILPRKKNSGQNYFFNLEQITSLDKLLKGEEVATSPLSEPDLFNYLYEVIGVTSDKHSPKHLFAGFGIFAGKIEDEVFFAPLLTSVCNISYEYGDSQITIDLGLNNIQFNYDFFARISDFQKVDEEADDNFLILEMEKFFRKIDNFLLTLESEGIDKEKLITLAEEVIGGANKKIEYFECKFFEPRTNLFEEKIDLIKDSPLFFEPDIFLFIGDVPGELTTYQSLNQLLEQDLQKNELLLTVLENKLLNTTKPFPKYEEIDVKEIENVLFKIPLELSENQKEAIIKTWSEPISYIQGPPGTGKSHTIQALIYSALLLGKKVLFVSHKHPAIEVVKKNLDRVLDKHSILFPSRNNQDYKNETIDYLKQIVDGFTSIIDIEKQKNRIKNLRLQKNNLEEAIISKINQIKTLNDSIQKVLAYVTHHKNFTDKVIEFRDRISKEIEKFNLNFKLNLRQYNFLPIENEQAPFKFNNLINLLFRILYNPQRKFIEKLMFLYISCKLSEKFQVPKKLISRSPNVLSDLYNLNYYGHRLLEVSDPFYGRELDSLREQILQLSNELQDLSNKLIPILNEYNIILKILSNIEVLKSIKNYYLSLKRVSKKYIQQHWQEIDFEALLEVFPIWCASLREVSNVLPMKPYLFDLIVIDEASQVNIAEVVPVFYRGKRFCIVGDDKQLHLNSVGLGFALSNAFDTISWGKNELQNFISFDDAKTRKLVVSEASILNFIMFEFESKSIPKVFLNEHYRSLPKLIGFNNLNFYDSELKIMTENGSTKSINCYKAFKVVGSRDKNEKFVQAEIDKAIEILEMLVLNDGWKNVEELQPIINSKEIKFSMPDGKPSIGIISFLRKQIEKFNKILDNNKRLDRGMLIEKCDFMIGTPEDFQGNERDIIIITFALDDKSSWGKQHYENSNRFNVATSRSRFFTYIVYAGIPKNAKLIEQYFNYIGIESPPRVDDWCFDKKRCESEFELNVAEYLEKYVSERNGIKLFNQVKALGGAFRLDFVLYNEKKNITLAVEVDGKHHFKGDSREYTKKHLERINILKRAGWEIINLKYFDWYFKGWLNDETIEQFKNYIKELYRKLDKLLQIEM